MANTMLQLKTNELLIDINPQNLAINITELSNKNIWTMREATDLDVLMQDNHGKEEWRSFTSFQSRETWISPDKTSVLINIPEACLALSVKIKNSNTVSFEVSPLNESDEFHPRDVLWPRHFIMPKNSDSYVAWPLNQGELMYGNKTTRFHHPEGYSEQAMSWFGAYKNGSGFVAIAHTPDDLYLAMWHDNNTAASAFIHWLPCHGHQRYSRKVTYQFGSKMDYKAMAKSYRKHIQESGQFVTLKEKYERNKNLEKLIGGCVLQCRAAMRNFREFTFDHIPFETTAKWLKTFKSQTGITNASVHLDGWGLHGYDNMHPDISPPNRTCGGSAGLKELSKTVHDLDYLFGLHDQYIDNYAHSPSHDPKDFKIKENGYPDKINNWAGGLCVHNCYTASLKYVKRNLFQGPKELYFRHNPPPIVSEYKTNAYYLDCFSRTVECFHPDHPLTRTQNREIQKEILRTVRTGNNGEGEPIALQIEHARDFILPEIDFAYGLGSVVEDVEVTDGSDVTETIGVSVPLWHLVFHDCCILPHTDNDTILNFLYGNPPWFRIGEWGDDFTTVNEKELTVKKRIMSLHKEVAFLEMTNHELLNHEGSIQRSDFEGISITADFKRKLVTITGGSSEINGEISCDF